MKRCAEYHKHIAGGKSPVNLSRQIHRILLSALTALAAIIVGAGVVFSQDWTIQSSGTTLLLHDIAVVDGLKCWAVGRDGTIVHSANAGESWSAQVSGTLSSLHSVSFVDSLTGWVVGATNDGGTTILHTTDGGNTWTLQTGVTGTFYGCHFINQSTGWVVGGRGKIVRTTNGGATWTVQRTQQDQLMFETHFLNDSTGYVTGQSGSAPRTAVLLSTTNSGATWNSLPVNGIRGLQSTFFTNHFNGWSVGWLGELIRTTDGGSTWIPQPSGRTDELLFSVFFNTTHSGWVVGGESGCELVNCDSLQGEQTIVLRTTDGGGTWASFPVPVTDQNLTKIYFSSPDTGWIVGGGGTILRTINGAAGAMTLPESARLLSPAEGVSVTTDSIELKWGQCQPAVDLYWVEYDEDSLFTSSIADSTLVDTVTTLYNLAEGSRYFWKVRAHNSSGWGPFSNMRAFTVNTLPSVPPSPILSSPADGSQAVSTTLNLTWLSIASESRDTLRYHVQVSQDSLFGILTFEDSVVTDTTCEVDGLGADTQYYWRVKGRNIRGAGQWSMICDFRTINSSISCSDLSRFQSRCLGGGSIQVTVVLLNTSHTGENIIVTIDSIPYMLTVASTRIAQMTMTGFGAGTHVVQLVNPAGCFNPINVSCIGTLLGEAVEEEVSEDILMLRSDEEGLVGELPRTTELIGTYPNPFNPTATIQFQLAAEGMVDLKVFNLIGQEVETLADGYFLPGKYSVQWDASDRASGTYICRFHIGNHVEFRKLLLVK